MTRMRRAMRYSSHAGLAFLFVLTGCTAAYQPPATPMADEVAIHHYDIDEYFDLSASGWSQGELLNRRLEGFRGIWYKNTDLDNEYVYKYSGGLGTYTDYHDPFAVYSPEVNRTFFTFGGTDDENSTLHHVVSYFDHQTGMVARPVLVLDKNTDDAHDNPVIQIDNEGHIWLFSTSHGVSRPSYVVRSRRPYDIDAFDVVPVTFLEDGVETPMTNFSYTMIWYLPNRGFISFFTKYGFPAPRTLMFKTSPDGVRWSEWQRLAAIESGHYQISATDGTRAGTAFNYHPDTSQRPQHVSFPVNYRLAEDGSYEFARAGLDYRTNLYYVETPDFGERWQAADGTGIELPITQIDNPALVRDYASEGLNVYPKDMVYDEDGRPVILYMTSGGYVSGPDNDPRTWKTARWDGTRWIVREMTTSDNNYDMGSLYIEEGGVWRVIAPTETGPQPYNTGGEMAMWVSRDQGESWRLEQQLTRDSEYNHSFARRPVDAHPEFYAFWADGHGRRPSESRLYFADRAGNVFQLPVRMTEEMEKPIPIP
jgi:hypothetical protein